MNDVPAKPASADRVQDATPSFLAPGGPAGPCAMVIFGGSGDLTKRKLLPALINLAKDRLLPKDFAMIALSRRPFSDEDFRRKLAQDLRELGEAAPDVEIWRWLEPRLFYQAGDLNEAATYAALGQRLLACDRAQKTGGNYLFYLSTAPEHFAPVVRQLGESGLAQQKEGHWRHVVIEKPFGRDLESARQLNQELRSVLHEGQIYRIDHYLGKETVQNILVLRFANGIFEPLWNRSYIDHVQIAVTETLGVETRGAYYEQSGALRDMVPNHLFQLVSLIGMEPPSNLDAHSIRDEQVKLLRAIRPLADNASKDVVRGQYGPGQIDSKRVPGYRAEENVAPTSSTETFVALKLDLDNWRWAGVPIYLRTGKRLDKRRTEIMIQFRRAPHLLFRNTAIAACQANQLLLSIQPEEGLSLRFGAKIPGPVVKLGTVTMDFDYRHVFGNRPSTGYERLLYDCMIGDPTLFQREDMAEMAWSIVAPLQKAWQDASAEKPQIYPAGSQGPEAALELLRRDGRSWHDEKDCP